MAREDRNPKVVQRSPRAKADCWFVWFCMAFEDIFDDCLIFDDICLMAGVWLFLKMF